MSLSCILFRWVVMLSLISIFAVADAAPVVSDTVVDFSNMTIIAETEGPDSGAIRFALFDRRTARRWCDGVLKAVELPVCTKRAVWRTAPLPDGAYALAVFHDCNGNDELDKNFFGAPVEPYGFSNNIRHTFGPPCMKEATFRFEATCRILVVKLR